MGSSRWLHERHAISTPHTNSIDSKGQESARSLGDLHLQLSALESARVCARLASILSRALKLLVVVRLLQLRDQQIQHAQLLCAASRAAIRATAHE